VLQRFAGKSFQSMGNVIDALNSAFKTTLETTNKTAVDVIETQFGKEAGRFTREGVAIGNDIYHTSRSMHDLTHPSHLFRTATRYAAHGAVSAFHQDTAKPAESTLGTKEISIDTEVDASSVSDKDKDSTGPELKVPLTSSNDGKVKAITYT